MKIIDKITLSVERTIATVTTKVGKHAPEIKFGVGAGLVIISGYLAYEAGKASRDQKNKEKLEDELTDIEHNKDPFTTKSFVRKAKIQAYATYALKEAKNAAPAFICMGGGMYLMKDGFNSVRASNLALQSALAASVATNKALEDRLIEEAGIDTRDMTIANAEKYEIEKTVVNEKGEIENYPDSYLVTDIYDLPGEAFIYSKETCSSDVFYDDENYFGRLVDEAKSLAERKLNHTHGYCFDSDIVELFGVEPKPIHYYCGSVTPDPKRPLPGDERRTGVLELYTRRIGIDHDDGSRSFGWLVVPKNDGVIIDIYDQYSLRRRYINEKGRNTK